MEKIELGETNETIPQAVVNLEGDALAIENEDRDEQSKGEKMPCIGVDDHEFGNEQVDISDKLISEAVEKLEGDDCVVQNEDYKESRQAEIQNNCHDGPEYENERDDISDEIRSPAIEKMEGDASTIQCEDHRKDSKEAEAQSIGYDSPGFEIESDDISDNVKEMVDVETNTPKEVKGNVTGMPEFAQRVDESRDLQCESPEENMEGDAFTTFTIQSEDSNTEKVQNIGNDGPDFEQSYDVSDNLKEVIYEEYNSQEEVKDNVTGVAELAQRVDESRDFLDEFREENMEGDAFTILSEDHHSKDSKDARVQNVGNDDPDFEKDSDDISDNLKEVIDVEYNTLEEVKDNVTGVAELAQRVDEIRDLQGEFQEENMEGDAFTILSEDHHSKDSKEARVQNVGNDDPDFEKDLDDISDNLKEMIDVESNSPEEVKDNVTGVAELAQRIDEIRDLQCEAQDEILETGCSSVPGELFQKENESNSMTSEIQVNIIGEEYSDVSVDSSEDLESKRVEVNSSDNSRKNDLVEEKDEGRISIEHNILVPVVDGVEVLGVEVIPCTSTLTFDADPGTPRVVEKAAAVKNFVREKSVVAVTTLLRRLSGKIDEGSVDNSDEGKGVSDLLGDSGSQEIKTVDAENKTDQKEEPITESPLQPIAMKGRIILYTRLGCQESKEVRQYLYMKRLRYVEINIDVYPSRKMELEKISGSTSVPKVFFNEILIGGLSELKTLSESGKLDEKIDFLISELPSFEGPFPPLSGEDDLSSSGALDEMALIVRKMKDSIVVKDRFSKLRRFTSCFLGSEAVDFLSEDQYLERKEAVEFGRKLASKLFFQHVLDENLFEDGNHFYRFLDDDPIVASQCQNIPRGIITVKPKPITELASRLRFLSYAMFEAYASDDGRHIDYRSMHGSEEFARYLRIVEELQRVEIFDLSREEKLAFFINLYNMMTIHAILVWGHPAGALERRKLFGEFKYVIGGSTYSLSVIQNGILRGNQRAPYTLMKPFGAKDKRLKVALPFSEPLIHFALVCGTRSGPALRCYSPGDIDKELMDAARNFLRNGGLLVDFAAKVAYASKILKWFSVDFGKSELEVMKHVSIYLDPAESELLLDLLATTELKVIYQPYDWGLNC